MSRCTGHCCRSFTLPCDWATMIAGAWYWFNTAVPPWAATAYGVAVRNSLAFENGYQIAHMVVPVPDSAEVHARYRSLLKDGLHYYACKNQSPSGDCTIYETRPQMCRNFPYEQPCPFVGCTATGET